MVNDLEQQLLNDLRQVVDDARQQAAHLEKMEATLTAYFTALEQARHEEGHIVVNSTSEAAPVQQQSVSNVARNVFGLLLIVAISIALGWALNADGDKARASEPRLDYPRPEPKQAILERWEPYIVKQPHAEAEYTHARENVNDGMMQFLEQNRGKPVEELIESGTQRRKELDEQWQKHQWQQRFER